jgi:GT2 family glycosyltransferase
MGPTLRVGGRDGRARMSAWPDVAVVVPTLDGGARLDALLDAVRRQDVPRPPRLVAIDSGSTDTTLASLRRHGATVLHTPAARFNHGASRNQALASVPEPFAALLVQDAVPATPDWLSALVAPLLADGRIAGTCARQRPYPEASAITRHYLRNWPASAPEPRVSGPWTVEQFAALTPGERHYAAIFDNVSSCVRMSVWREHPFADAPFAEDLEWARDVLLAGHRIAYVPAAVVWHSHERSAGYELRRTYLAHQRLHHLFGLTTVPTAGACLRAIASSLALHVRLTGRERRRRLRALARGAALAVALPVGQYLGARSDRGGRAWPRIRGI